MIKHIVMWKFADNALGKTKNESVPKGIKRSCRSDRGYQISSDWR